MGINQDLARLYSQTEDPEQQKVAEAELFCKIAAQNGIDFNSLTDDQVGHLWSETMGKTAEDMPFPPKKDEEAKKDDEKKDEEKKDEEKKEAAAREHAVKLAEAREDARADELGRKMAHAFADEADKIASVRNGSTPTKTASTASALPPKLAAAVNRAREASKTASAPAAAPSASHIDGLAIEEAVKIAAESGFDPEEAANRVWAVYTLGLSESTKLASTLPEQVNLRALEYLEAAKYPVEWH